MATLSQILAGLRADQQLGQKETLGMLGSSIFESEKSIKEGNRAYQEAADDVGLDIQDYGEKGAKIDTLQTLGSLIPGAAVPLAILGFGARRARKKPKFTFDINKAAPGFEDRLFADQAGKDLLSSIEGTRDIVSQALKGSFFNDLVSTATSLYGGYQAAELAGTVSKGTSFMDYLKGVSETTTGNTDGLSPRIPTGDLSIPEELMPGYGDE